MTDSAMTPDDTGPQEDPRPGVAHGTAVWSSTAWRDAAISWIDERLAAAGMERSGDVDQPHLRPWSTVLRIPTADGVVWFKATGPGTTFEVALYDVLADTVPDRVLIPIATDPGRGWAILPDGGPPLAERLDGDDLTDALVVALVRYGELQLDLAPHVDDLVNLGVADMRPSRIPQRFDEALEASASVIDRLGRQADRVAHRRVAAMRDTVVAWSERLAESRVPASLDHNDLHPWNILGNGADDVRFYDWGDGVIAHSFAAMLVPLGFVRHQLDVSLDHPAFVRARDAYLEVFGAITQGEDLVETLELACRVAKVPRALTWERALRAAREQGEAIDEFWATAPMESMASLLDASYVSGV